MKKSTNVLLWIIAFLLTIGIAFYQRKTGPTQPLNGRITLGDTQFKYSLKRTHGGEDNHKIELTIPDSAITGFVIWKHFKLDEPLHHIILERENDKLIAFLPHQPPAGKLEYQIDLNGHQEEIRLPAKKPAVIRFKGEVPRWILIPHIIAMFGALFLATRATIAAFFGHRAKNLTTYVVGFLLAGGIILGPLVQKYAFGTLWTGWPLGEDLTDNKTALTLVFWLLARWQLRGADGERKGRWFVMLAFIVMFGVYLIPHSMKGSELDYSSLPADSLENAVVKDSMDSIDTVRIE